MAFDDDNDGSREFGIGPRDLLRTARDYWLLAVILAAPASVGFYFWKKSETPVYASRALILFEVQSEQVVDITEVIDQSLAGGGGPGMENYLAHLGSRAFLQEVVDVLTEGETQQFVGPYEVVEEGEEPVAVAPLGLIARNFGYESTGQGTTVLLRFEHRDPQIAALLLNRITDQFTVFLTRRAARANDSAIKFLMSEAEELRQQVRESDLVLQKYREDNNVISLADTQNLVERQLAQVSGAVSEAFLARLQAEGVLERSMKALEASEPIAKIPAVMSYADVRAVLAEINRLESELSVLGLRYGSRYPTMISKREVLGLTRKRLDNLVTESREFLHGQSIAAIEKHERLQAEQYRLERKSLELDRLGIEFNVLMRRFESQKMTYDRIIGRLNETVISSKLVRSPVRVVDSASVSSIPVRPDPKKILMTAVGLFGVIFGGIIGAFALLDRRIRSGSVIEEQLEVDVLGEIPDLKGIRTRDKMNVVASNQDPAMAEAFRSASGKVILAGRAPCPKTVLVTSGSPGEGKSLFCANLAHALVEQGKRVLLVDCDFRAPALDSLIDEASAAGSSDWYAGGTNDATLFGDLGNYRLSLKAGLDFLSAGVERGRPQEILTDDRFRSALLGLSRQYDYTLIDGPPGLVFHDAIGIADWVTETIVIARYLKVTVVRLKRLLSQLEKTRSLKLGVVLNGVPAMQSNEGYYRHARRYYDRDGRQKSKKKPSGKKFISPEKKPKVAIL